MQGLVKTTAMAHKGFIFVTGDDRTDYFLHVSNFHPREGFRTLKVGDRLEFADCESDRGPCAEDAELV